MGRSTSCGRTCRPRRAGGLGLALAGRKVPALLSYLPGDRVTYVDERGRPHAALVTCWWGAHEHAACNLVYIDETEPTDSYGAARRCVTSVSRGPSGAPGRYWQPSHEPMTLVADDFAAPAEATAPA